MILRPMQRKDLRQVADIEQASFTDPWRYEDFEDSLNREDDTIILLVATADDDTTVHGYITLYGAAGEGEIMNIAVDEKMRRGGVAGALLAGAIAEAKKRPMNPQSIFLEVRQSNEAAIAFYEKSGFEAIAIRRGFYQNPPEDALVMQLFFGDEKA